MAKMRYRFDYSLKTRPFAHQTEAVAFMKGKRQVALFDEQGLGKTKVVIDVILEDIRSEMIDGALIVCRKYLLANWEEEIRKHSYLKYVTLTGTKGTKGARFMVFSYFYLVNYESLITEIDRITMLLTIRRLAIVLDESQKIKNPDSRTAQSVFKLRPMAAKRIIISGTPIANKPEDIWAQFYFLDDGELLGKSFNTFRKHYGIEVRGETLGVMSRNLSRLREDINSVSIRRLKNQVLELPEKRYEDVVVTLQGQQKNMYDKMRDDLYLEVRKLDGEQVIDEAQNILKKLLRLTQIASNPALLHAEYSEVPAKFFALDRLVERIVGRGEKVIIWTAFVENVRTLRKRYSRFFPLMLFGEIPMVKRNIIVQKFMNDAALRVLVANPAAAREGLTLTSANNAIYLDRNFSLVDYLQSQDRIHRISQVRVCNIMKIIAKNTIDEYIDEVVFKKQRVAQFVQGDLQELRDDRQYMTKEEIMELLGRRA
jgi:SNF2 family DNA or RNA helicase